ncbi:hypothetical protein [Alkalibacillus haloalkaliphilus]|uniref:hypothetical protein n=1 Tax=Alkalibacillus haloalkaliphilus TaxID=94136 RepID=UPI002935A48A|nr:hypothetical protein [Alkalibacillus haloalkaliphilus]MDV2580906.1 hypothetical protein [Alkalibacillus haloalkaliphilus]
MNNLHASDVIYNKAQSKSNVSLVLGFLSIVTSFVSIGLILGIIGFVYGVVGLRQMNGINQTGKRKVVVGMSFSLAGILLTIIFSITFGMLLFS